MSCMFKFEPWKLGSIIYSWLLQFILKVDDVFFVRKLTLSTILTFFISYEIRYSSCGDECNFNKTRALLHPNVLNDIFPKKGLHNQKAHMVGFDTIVHWFMIANFNWNETLYMIQIRFNTSQIIKIINT
jgi:hypothetical protein